MSAQAEPWIIIEPLSAEDGGGFLGTVPALPGCMSDGETMAEATENTKDAIAEWLDEAATIPPSVWLAQRC